MREEGLLQAMRKESGEGIFGRSMDSIGIACVIREQEFILALESNAGTCCPGTLRDPGEGGAKLHGYVSSKQLPWNENEVRVFRIIGRNGLYVREKWFLCFIIG